MNVPNESLGISGLDDGLPDTTTAQISENYLMSWLGRVNYSYRSVTCLPCRSVPTVRRSSHPRIAGVSFHRERSPGGSVRRSSCRRLRFIDDAKLRELRCHG